MKETIEIARTDSSWLAPMADLMAAMADVPQTDVPAARHMTSPADMPAGVRGRKYGAAVSGCGDSSCCPELEVWTNAPPPLGPRRSGAMPS